METQTQLPVTQVTTPVEAVVAETQPVTAPAPAGEVLPVVEAVAASTEAVADAKEEPPSVSPVAGLVGALVLALVALAVKRLRQK